MSLSGKTETPGRIKFQSCSKSIFEKQRRIIREIVTRLQRELGKENLRLTDFWDADKTAVGLSNITKRRRAYISTNAEN